MGKRLENDFPSLFRRKRKLTSIENWLMLYTLALVLVIAWLLGLVSSYTLGGFIHILLVVALIMIVVRLIQGQRVD